MRIVAGGARLAPVVGLVAAVGMAGEAQASGFQLKEQSAEGLGNAFAGSTAKAQDLSTIFFNPAGMTKLSGHQTQAVLSYIAPTAEFTATGSGNTTFGGPISGVGNQDDAAENAVIPAFYLFYDYSDDIKFGLSVNTPFGLVTDYDENWVGRYHALKSDLMTIAIQPSIAYQVNDWLSVGGGPVFQYADAELTKALDARTAVFAGMLGAGMPLPTALAASAGVEDAYSKVTGDNIAAGYTIGLMFEPMETTRIGVSYRSRITHDLSGEVEFSNVDPLLAGNPGLAAGSGRAELNLPDTASLGVYHEFSPNFAVMGEVAWTNWSLFRELSVYRGGEASPISSTLENWNDTWFYSLGATYSPMEKLKLQIGVAYDQSPVPDATRTPRVPDADRTWLSLGAGYEVMPGVSANLAYTHIWVEDANINLGNEGAGLPEHNISGTYKSDIDIISAQVKVTF